MFWSFIDKNLDIAVYPVPFLQIVNLICGLVVYTFEFPLVSRVFMSPKVRVYYLLLPALVASSLYQTFDLAIYYLICIFLYQWAHKEGEVNLGTSFPFRTNLV